MEDVCSDNNCDLYAIQNENDILEIYLKQIAEYPLLSAGEERDLAESIMKKRERLEELIKARSADDKTITCNMLREAKEELYVSKEKMIHSNLRLVVSIAKKLQYRGLPLADVINEGNIGLIEAVERFDYTRGCRFSTYGTWWIRQTIMKSVAEKSRTIRIPVHMLNSIQKYHIATKHLTTELGRNPEMEELAQYLHCPLEKIRIIQELGQGTTSLDSTIDNEGITTLIDLVTDLNAEEPFDQVFNLSLEHTLNEILETLPERERKVLQLRFGLTGEGPFTLEETGKRVGVTRERVRQIQDKTIRILRNMGKIQDYTAT